MKSLFEYINYRCYLADYYAEQKAKRSTFSYRYFSNKIGFKSKDFIYRVINKDKKISDTSIGNISRALAHGEKESEYFEYLVKFNQGETAADKNRYFSRLNAHREKYAKAHNVKLISDDQYDFFSKWYIPVLFNLVEVTRFEGNFSDLAKLVNPRITAKEARSGVQTLIKLGLVSKNDNGSYKVKHKSLSTKNELDSLGLLNYYIKGTSLAASAMSNLPKDQRNVSGLTVGISRKAYGELTDKINAFREELSRFVANDNDPERVYQVNFQIIPVSEPLKKNEMKR